LGVNEVSIDGIAKGHFDTSSKFVFKSGG
jgi:hypothetical protein